MGKPRMTQQDKWIKRPCVLEYWDYKAAIRLVVGSLPADTHTVSWVAYFSMPKSWSKKKKARLAGERHQTRPDRDNVDKGILDALFDNDSRVSDGSLSKRWDDGDGARIELSWE